MHEPLRRVNFVACTHTIKHFMFDINKVRLTLFAFYFAQIDFFLEIASAFVRPSSPTQINKLSQVCVVWRTSLRAHRDLLLFKKEWAACATLRSNCHAFVCKKTQAVKRFVSDVVSVFWR